MLGEVTVCSVVHVFVGRLIRGGGVVDVGFDSDKHAQTRNDMKRGGGVPGGLLGGARPTH